MYLYYLYHPYYLHYSYNLLIILIMHILHIIPCGNRYRAGILPDGPFRRMGTDGPDDHGKMGARWARVTQKIDMTFSEWRTKNIQAQAHPSA